MTKSIYYPLIFIFIPLIGIIAASLAAKLNWHILARNRLARFYTVLNNGIIWYFMAIYFITFSTLSVLKYLAYNMAMVDLGRMSQSIWNTLQGRFLFGTFEFGNATRLIAHSEFIYLLIAPIYFLFPDPRTLLIIQTLVVSLGALPIYWLARDKLGGKFLPAIFSLAYLTYPSLQYGNLNDFHPDMLATTFLLFTFYFIEKRAWIKYFVFLTLALLCKEYVSLIAIMIGIYILIKKKSFKFGFVTIALGFFLFLANYKFLPLILNRNENLLIELYAPLGMNLSGILRNIILNPFNVIRQFVTFDMIGNLTLLLIPLGFLSLLNLPVLLLGLPIFIGLILTPFFSYANHHNGTLIPFIFISAINGSYFISKYFRGKIKNINRALGVFVLVCSLLSTVFYGASFLSWRLWDKSSYQYWGNIWQFKITDHDRIADKIINLIPDSASVSASNHLASHISNRETIYHFPHPKKFDNIDYILVDILEYFPTYWGPREEERSCLKDLILDDSFGLMYFEDGILLFKKGLKENTYQVKTVKLKQASPSNKVNFSFDNRLELLGYDFEDQLLEESGKRRIVYYWRVLEDFDKEFNYEYFDYLEKLKTEFILIDTIQVANHSIRLVHIPLYILQGSLGWKKGDVIREEFDFYLSGNFIKDSFLWKIGMYGAPRSFFIQTDNKNLVAGTEEYLLKNE